MQLGILGGTFDPIHHGHLAIAADALWQLQLDRVHFLPAAQQPLKPGGHAATAAHRLAMTRLAVADEPRFAVSDIEVRRAGLSYTVRTVAALQQQHPADVLWFIIGADSLHTLPRWHHVERLLTLCRFAVVGRPGYEASLPAALQSYAARFAFISGPALDISATALRTRIAQGAPVRYQMPAPVCDYIATHNLYRTP